MSNIFWLQLLKCDNLLFFFDIYEFKLNILVFRLSLRQYKQMEETAMAH